jgi:hypothetical protein
MLDHSDIVDKSVSFSSNFKEIATYVIKENIYSYISQSSQQ